MALFRYQAELGIDSGELAFVCYMLTYRWIPGNLPYPSLRGMAKATGEQVKTLRRRKDSLVKKGYLIVIIRKDQTSSQLTNGYDFTPLFQKLEHIIESHNKDNGPKPANGVVFDDPPPPGDKMTPGGDKMTPAGVTSDPAPGSPATPELDTTIRSVVVSHEPSMNLQVHSSNISIPEEWTLSGIQQKVAAISGATIAPSFAEQIQRTYTPEDLSRALNEMQRQLAAGLKFTTGVGAWLRSALKRRYNKDTIPPASKQPSQGRPGGRRKQTGTADADLAEVEQFNPTLAAELRTLREQEHAREVEKAAQAELAALKHKEFLKKLYAT
jgi:hypothetical protein